jgi:hypothetical protein
VLRHQLAVFQKNAPRRLRLHRCDRRLWVVLYRCWSGWRRCLENRLSRPPLICMCAVRPNGFLSSKIFTLCRSEDRIQSFSTKNGLVFWSRLKFWRPTSVTSRLRKLSPRLWTTSFPRPQTSRPSDALFRERSDTTSNGRGASLLGQSEAPSCRRGNLRT